MLVFPLRRLTAQVTIASFLWSQLMGSITLCRASDPSAYELPDHNLQDHYRYSSSTTSGELDEDFEGRLSFFSSSTSSSSEEKSATTSYAYSAKQNAILNVLSNWKGDWQGEVEQQLDQETVKRWLVLQRHQIACYQSKEQYQKAQSNLQPSNKSPNGNWAKKPENALESKQESRHKSKINLPDNSATTELTWSYLKNFEVREQTAAFTARGQRYSFKFNSNNQEGLQALQHFFDHQQQWEALHQLGASFVTKAITCGRMIIEEYELPVQLKTIKPANVGGIAGGDKYIVHGILFKFAKDQLMQSGVWLYGGKTSSDSLAFKSAGQELLGSNYVTSYGKLFKTPLTAVIDYRGYRLMANSLIPINDHSLVYGSADGAQTIYDNDRVVSQAVAKLGRELNLQSHDVKNISMALCGDVEIHRCRFAGELEIACYCLDLARIFPPEAPLSTLGQTLGNQGSDNTIFSQKLRPEFVMNYETPLSADAFTRFHTDPGERQQANTDIAIATQYLQQTIVPAVVNKLLYPDNIATLRQSMSKRIATQSQDLTILPLVTLLHQHGVNVRHLGRVWQHLQNMLASKAPQSGDSLAKDSKENISFLQRHVANVMILRVLKNYARLRLREESDNGNDDKEFLLEIMNYLTCRAPQSRGFWKQQVPDLLRNTFHVEIPELPTLLHQGYLLTNFCRTMGVLLNHNVFERFCQYYDASLAFEYGLSDIVDIQPTVKYLNVIDLATGIYHSMKARNVSNPNSRVALDYWKKAQDKLKTSALTWHFSDSELLPQNLSSLLEDLSATITQIEQSRATTPRLGNSLPNKPRSGSLPQHRQGLSTSSREDKAVSKTDAHLDPWWTSLSYRQAGVKGIDNAALELRTRLLKLTGADVDVVGKAIYQLQQAQQQHQRDQVRIDRLLPRLQPPEVLLKERAISSLVRDLKQVTLTDPEARQAVCQLVQYYQGVARTYRQASPDKQEEMLLPRATLRLFDEPTGYRLLQETAYKLLGINAYGERVRDLDLPISENANNCNEDSPLHLAGIKLRTASPTFVTDNAVYLLQKLLFGQGGTPSTLLVLEDVDLWETQKETLLPDSLLQALCQGQLEQKLAQNPAQQSLFTIKQTQHIIQASLEPPTGKKSLGKPLTEYLLDEPHGLLDANSYGSQILTQLLLGFPAGDSHPANHYIVYPLQNHRQDHWQLLRLTTQLHNFAPRLSAKEQFVSQGLPQGEALSSYIQPSPLIDKGLDQRMSSRLKQRLLTLNPAAEWINWLGLLAKQMPYWQVLQDLEDGLQSSEMTQTNFSVMQNFSCDFPWELPRQRLQQMQQILQEPSAAYLTYAQLLLQIDFPVGRIQQHLSLAPLASDKIPQTKDRSMEATADSRLSLNVLLQDISELTMVAPASSHLSPLQQIEQSVRQGLNNIPIFSQTAGYQKPRQIMLSVAAAFANLGTELLETYRHPEQMLGFIRHCLQHVKDPTLIKMLATSPIDWSKLYSTLDSQPDQQNRSDSLNRSSSGAFSSLAHGLIRQHHKDEEHLLFLLKTLKPHLVVTAQNQLDEYPIDLAVECRLEKVFAYLVYLNSPRISERRWRETIEFGRTLQQNQAKRAFRVLEQRDSHLRWRMALSYILPADDHGEVTTANLGTRTLAPEARRQLFDRRGKIRSINLSAAITHSNIIGHPQSSTLARVKLENYALYFKQLPLLSGIDRAGSALIRRIASFGAPHKDLIRIENMPYIVFMGTPGASLDKVLQKDPALLDSLEPVSLSQMLLATMVVAPALGQPQNYVVEPLLQDQEIYRGFSSQSPLLSFSDDIDIDGKENADKQQSDLATTPASNLQKTHAKRFAAEKNSPKTAPARPTQALPAKSQIPSPKIASFVPDKQLLLKRRHARTLDPTSLHESWRVSTSMSEELRGYRLVSIMDEFSFATPGEKAANVLFCLEAMHQLVAPEAVKSFLAIDINFLLKKWGRRVSDMNSSAQKLFNKSEQLELFASYGALIGVPFSPEMQKVVYERLQLLQDILSQDNHNQLTHLQILARLDPVAAACYRHALGQYQDVPSRFANLASTTLEHKGKDPVSWVHNYIKTLLGTSQTMEALVANLHQGGSFSPEAATLALSTLITPQRQQNLPTDLLALPTRRARETAVKTQNFKEIDAPHTQAWIAALQSTLNPLEKNTTPSFAYRTLSLSGASFAQELLVPGNLQFLTQLQVRHGHLSDKFFPLLAQVCPGLITADFSHCTGIKKVGTIAPKNPEVPPAFVQSFKAQDTTELPDNSLSDQESAQYDSKSQPSPKPQHKSRHHPKSKAGRGIRVPGKSHKSFKHQEQKSPRISSGRTSAGKPPQVNVQVDKRGTLQRFSGKHRDSQNKKTLTFAALEALNLSHNTTLQQVLLRAPQLRELRLNNCPSLQTLALAATKLQNLYLKQSQKLQDTESIAALLATLSSLQTLELDVPEVTASDGYPPHHIWQYIPQAPLQGWQLIKKAAQKQILATLTNEIEQWQFIGYSLGEKPGEALAPDVLKLLTLSLQHNTSLTRLNLSFKNLTGAQASSLLAVLQNHPKVQYLNLQNNQLGDRGAQALRYLNAGLTRSLNLQENQIGVQGAEGIALFIAHSFCLEELLLSHNQLGDAGMQALTKGLGYANQLQTLHLSKVAIGSPGARVLGNTLKLMPHLTALFLSHNAIDNNGVKRLAKGLQHNQNLQTLDLSSNAIAGAEGLQLLLSHNGLTALRIASNPLEADGIQALVANLPSHPRLLSLDLSDTKMLEQEGKQNMAGIRALTSALASNNILKEVKLKNNNLGQTAVAFVLEALKANQTLLDVRVGEGATPEQAAQLTKLLQQRQTPLQRQRQRKQSRPAIGLNSQQELGSHLGSPDIIGKIWRANVENQPYSFYAKVLLTADNLPFYLGIDLSNTHLLSQVSPEIRTQILPLAKQGFIKDQWPATLRNSIYHHLRQQYQLNQGQDALAKVEQQLVAYCCTGEVFSALMQHYLNQGLHLQSELASEFATTSLQDDAGLAILTALASSYKIGLNLWQQDANRFNSLTLLQQIGISPYNNLLKTPDAYYLLANAEQQQIFNPSKNNAISRPYLGLSLVDELSPAVSTVDSLPQQSSTGQLFNLSNTLLLRQLERQIQEYTVHYQAHEIFDVISSSAQNSFLALGCTLSQKSPNYQQPRHRLWDPESLYQWQQRYRDKKFSKKQLHQVLEERFVTENLTPLYLSQCLTEVILPLSVRSKLAQRFPSIATTRSRYRVPLSPTVPMIINSFQAKSWANFDFAASDLLLASYAMQGAFTDSQPFSFSNANNTADYEIVKDWSSIDHAKFDVSALGIARLQQLAAKPQEITWVSLGGGLQTALDTSGIDYYEITHSSLELNLRRISVAELGVMSDEIISDDIPITAQSSLSSIDSLDELARQLAELQAQKWEDN